VAHWHFDAGSQAPGGLAFEALGDPARFSWRANLAAREGASLACRRLPCWRAPGAPPPNPRGGIGFGWKRARGNGSISRAGPLVLAKAKRHRRVLKRSSAFPHRPPAKVWCSLAASATELAPIGPGLAFSGESAPGHAGAAVRGAGWTGQRANPGLYRLLNGPGN